MTKLAVSPLVQSIRAALQDGEAVAQSISAALCAALVSAGTKGTDGPLLSADSEVQGIKGKGKVQRAIRAGWAAVGKSGKRANKDGKSIPAFLVDGLTYGKMAPDAAQTLADDAAARFALAFAEEFEAEQRTKVQPASAILARACKTITEADARALLAFVRTNECAAMLGKLAAIQAGADATEAARAAGAKATKVPAAPVAAPAAAPAVSPKVTESQAGKARAASANGSSMAQALAAAGIVPTVQAVAA